MTGPLRTYLCPECDGWGEHVTNSSPLGDPACEKSWPCYDCDSRGVIQAEADRDDLQLWTGDTGRERSRPQRRHIEPLESLAKARSAPRWSAAHAYHYKPLLARVMRPVLGQLRMIEAAIRCDVAGREALQAWRNAA